MLEKRCLTNNWSCVFFSLCKTDAINTCGNALICHWVKAYGEHVITKKSAKVKLENLVKNYCNHVFVKRMYGFLLIFFWCINIYLVLLKVLCFIFYFYISGILCYYHCQYYFIIIIMIIIAIILIILVTIKVWLGTFSKVYSDSMRATWRWCQETSVFPLAMPTHVLA